MKNKIASNLMVNYPMLQVNTAFFFLRCQGFLLYVVQIPINLPTRENIPRLCRDVRDSIQEKGQQFKNQITTFTTLWSEYKASWQYWIYIYTYSFQKHRRVITPHTIKLYLGCNELLCPRQNETWDKNLHPQYLDTAGKGMCQILLCPSNSSTPFCWHSSQCTKVNITNFTLIRPLNFWLLFFEKYPISTLIRHLYKTNISVQDMGLFIALFSKENSIS